MIAGDETFAFIREAYRFVGNRLAPIRMNRPERDWFETRLMGSTAVCVSGPEAARMFYEEGALTRQGALPPSALTLLQDKGSVAVLNDEAHRRRKAMFMGFMTRGSYDRLLDLAAREWRAAGARWELRPSLSLRAVSAEVIARAVAGWSGIPLPEEEASSIADDHLRLIDGAGSVATRQVKGQLARRRLERWAAEAVGQCRSGRLSGLPDEAPLRVIATHRENGSLLPVKVAAVELLNVMRPAVAAANFIAFAGLYLHLEPGAAARVRAGGEERTDLFVQETRRLAPFFPVVAGVVREPFEWQDRRFTEGERVILDLYGTNRDARIWEIPNSFRPERFMGWEGNPYTLIPQGGGDHLRGHRCPGEWITIDLMRQAVDFLARDSEWTVPPQDLTVDLSRMPAIPASGMVLADFRLAARTGNGTTENDRVTETEDADGLAGPMSRPEDVIS